MYSLYRNRFFIQNPEKCGIYDEDVFIENNTDTPELQEEQVPDFVKLSEKGCYGSIKTLLDDCPPNQKSALVNAGDKGRFPFNIWLLPPHPPPFLEFKKSPPPPFFIGN